MGLGRDLYLWVAQGVARPFTWPEGEAYSLGENKGG